MVAGSMEVRLVLPCLDITAEFWCCLAKWMDGCETSSTKKGLATAMKMGSQMEIMPKL